MDWERHASCFQGCSAVVEPAFGAPHPMALSARRRPWSHPVSHTPRRVEEFMVYKTCRLKMFIGLSHNAPASVLLVTPQDWQ